MIGFCEGGARCDPHTLKNDFSRRGCLMAFHLMYHFRPFLLFRSISFSDGIRVYTAAVAAKCGNQTLILSAVLKCRHVQLCFQTSFQSIVSFRCGHDVYFNPLREQFLWGNLQKCERVFQNISK